MLCCGKKLIKSYVLAGVLDTRVPHFFNSKIPGLFEEFSRIAYYISTVFIPGFHIVWHNLANDVPRCYQFL